MKRRMIAALVAIVGCAPPHADREIHVSNWSGADDDGEYGRKVQDLYRSYEERSGQRVVVETVPGEYMQKMVMSMVAGSPPDVMAVDASSAAVFIDNRRLLDLRPFIERDPLFRVGDYFRTALDVYRRGKAIYAIPGDFTPMVMYFNKRLFDRSGVPYPKSPWTFDDFLDAAKRTTTPGKQYGFKFTNWVPGWVMWLWNNGGDVVDGDGRHALGVLDSDANVRTIEFLRDLVNRYHVAPSLSQAAASGVDPFAIGQAAMMVRGHWEIPGLIASGKLKLDDIGVVELPSNVGQSKTVLYEVGFAIPAGAHDPQAAWDFIRYQTSRSFQTIYQSTGIAVCARSDVARERATNPVEKAFIDVIPNGRPPRGASFIGYDFVESEGVKMMDAVLAGEPVRPALQRMARRIDEFLRVR